MIRITPLADDVGVFYLFCPDGWCPTTLLWGPFKSNYTLPAPASIELESQVESFAESRGIYHENDVSHTKVEGDIKFNPFHTRILARPTTAYPNQILFSNRYCSLGYPLPGTTQKAATPYLYQYMGHNGSKYITYALYYSTSSRFKLLARYEVSALNSAQIIQQSWTICPDSAKPNPLNGTLLSAQTNVAELFESLWGNENCISGTGGPSVRSCSSFVVTALPGITQAEIFKEVDAKAAAMTSGNPDLFDYGDLAMDAVAKTNAIGINMIAFLRDLEHPLDMIPKLKNLRKLKSWSNDFLSVKYGILPTISDLQKIVQAFRRAAPYLDGNGYTTYTGVRTANSDVIGVQTAHLEQRIKIAVDTEDAGFRSLSKRLDSIGMFPTFENIWDLVPYSFVVDWFVSVGDLLERVDTRLRILQLKIAYTTMSYKRTTVFNVANLGLSVTGELKVVVYHRWVSDQCPLPRLSLGSQLGDFNHWLESGALLIQRAK